jgi:hypothetical protein
MVVGVGGGAAVGGGAEMVAVEAEAPAGGGVRDSKAR